MTTLADYSGRSIDLVAFQDVLKGGGEQLLAQSLVGHADGGSVISGIQVLVQRVLIGLLTRAGTKRRRDEGTTFLLDADVGLWRTAGDVEQSFYAATIALKRQIQANEDGEPDDQRWGSVELLNVVLADDKVTIRVRVSSLAGSSAVFLSPLQVSLQ